MVGVNIAPGKYVIAVSGGVDSMVLLDFLRRKKSVQLIVAHVNHGIRADSNNDEHFVQTIAKKYNLPFISTRLNLSASTGEAEAREARYAFLRQCCKKNNAKAIITAHHKDDMIETAIINIIRGTGWRGVAPFINSLDILRPLLDVSKNQLIRYARAHGIHWNEDSTNANEHHLRNYVRHTLIPMLDQKSSNWEESFLQLIRKQRMVRHKIDGLLSDQQELSTRYSLIIAPESVALELLQAHFREITGSGVVRNVAKAALLFTKTATPHKIMPINGLWQLRVTLRDFIVEPRADVIR